MGWRTVGKPALRVSARHLTVPRGGPTEVVADTLFCCVAEVRFRPLPTAARNKSAPCVPGPPFLQSFRPSLPRRGRRRQCMTRHSSVEKRLPLRGNDDKVSGGLESTWQVTTTQQLCSNASDACRRTYSGQQWGLRRNDDRGQVGMSIRGGRPKVAPPCAARPSVPRHLPVPDGSGVNPE